MALVYVGGNSNNGTAASSVSVSLTGLTGGASSSAATNDIVIVAASLGNDTLVSPVIDTSGYTNIATLTADDTADCGLICSYKIMGGTPDTTVAASMTSGTADEALSVAVHVWRNENTTTPQDVASTTATGTSSSRPNPASITPTTAGVVVIAVGGNSISNSGTPADNVINAAPSGYSNLVTNAYTAHSGTGQQNCSVGIASKSWTSGAEDPGIFNTTASSSASAWCAVTIALRPAINNSGFFMLM